MARENNEAPGAGQSKRPSMIHFDSSDQTQQHTVVQPHHRVKSQKHIVGGGSRLHARVPSSKGLHKHHGGATASTTKLNNHHRQHGSGSISPDKDGEGLTLVSKRHHHRRATSELKLTGDATTSSNHIQKNVSQTNLKRNRSQADVGKKSKSTTSLHRHTVSNPNVNKLKSSREGSKVHFNLGDDEQEDDSQDDGEWVDASTSASPLLSRRGSTIGGNGQPTNPNPPPPPPTNEIQNKQLPTVVASPPSPTSHRDIPSKQQAPPESGSGLHSADSSFTRNATLANTITSRILSRAPSQGAAPKMSTEIAVAPRPPAPRLPSAPPTRPGSSQRMSPGEASLMQLAGGVGPRPGSSGRAELLTSRFVGGSSQEPGSGIAADSFIVAAAANKGGVSRAALGGKADAGIPRRPRSMGSLSHAHEQLNGGRYDQQQHTDDEEGVQHQSNGARTRRNGNGYVVPRDMNRTQQKLNLQRASSGLESTASGQAMVPVGGGGAPSLLMGAVGGGGGVVSNYGTANPKHGKILEKTGMQYLSVRRHQNPIARSVARIWQLPGMEIKAQRIPPPSRAASTRRGDLGRLAVEGGGTRPPSRAASGLRVGESAASSLGTDDELGGGNGGGGGKGRLSGASLVDGGNDAATRAQLEMMWNQSMDLSASQE
ncbi:uncharacterized protein PODANS_4_9340 [Podospora anserina S mat+]|uniref:Podospora anserina S mat+ genomic DNA chromosome 4, supercontig 4 n=1 Tax=Podospora anserina (strain S / ATCC MYA-4624 / DSM 980 / FGSC 10383) TaxID=515849 RepID=B2AQX8_PODAN|nr:uncharacterized protein PODANS_4_9340 [Podospora anserina S mat+]CAP66556.1 unnamed protein product [Podospora anserina S mat+]CDP28288.1 Putative protein of unknown function [Podospora anserina S mat+]